MVLGYVPLTKLPERIRLVYQTTTSSTIIITNTCRTGKTHLKLSRVMIVTAKDAMEIDIPM